MLNWFGLFLIFSGLAGAAVLGLELKRNKLSGFSAPFEWLFPIVLTAFLGAKVGGILDDLPEFRADPWGYLKSSTGHSFYGGLAVGILALVVLTRIKRLPLKRFLDCLAPALMLGYAIGRIGCHVDGDGCYGVASSLPWAMSYPNGSVPTLEHVHPAPLYESVAALMIFIFIWKIRKRNLAQGFLFVTAILLYGIERFLVEFVRRNPLYGPFSQAQWISIGIISIGIAFICLARRKAPFNKD